MSKKAISRRTLIAGSSGAVLVSLAVAGLGSNEALAATKQPLPGDDKRDLTDHPDGAAYYEQFKASGLI